jgi:glutathione S-transferase
VIDWSRDARDTTLLAMSDRTLLQFPISHYCEKTRWHMDAKGLPYTTRNVIPGVHLAVGRQLASGSTLPILIERGKAIGDSTAIAMHLERAHPDRPLVPRDDANRARVLELEEYFDEAAGPSVRTWLYGLILAHGNVGPVFFRGYGSVVELAARPLGYAMAFALRVRYGIDRDSVARARTTLLDAIERLERTIDGDPKRYLVGGALTLADITAASLLAPLLAPPNSPWEGRPIQAEPLLAFRDTLRARPAGQWITERYRSDRDRLAVA